MNSYERIYSLLIESVTVAAHEVGREAQFAAKDRILRARGFKPGRGSLRNLGDADRDRMYAVVAKERRRAEARASGSPEAHAVPPADVPGKYARLAFAKRMKKGRER